MKTVKKLIICFFSASLFLPAIAQETELQDLLRRGGIYPGFIITLQGDTVEGFMLNINLWLNQMMTYYYSDSTDFKGRVKYKAKDIKAYQVGNRYYESMKYSFLNSSKKQNFIQKKYDGPISMYIWYYNPDQPNFMDKDLTLKELGSAFMFDEEELHTNLYGMKANGEFTNLTHWKFLIKFAKSMSAYVADDAVLADKIRNKTEGYVGLDRDIVRILLEYNERKMDAEF